MPLAEHQELRTLFEQSGFTVLHNDTVQIGKGRARLNITGLGDLMANQCIPHEAFAHYDPRYPSIVLSHNPDSFDLLEHYPGDLLLFGHTHGGQVNIPFMWKKITPIKNLAMKSGLISKNGRFLYINRGLGSTFPFRWFAPPEITRFTLVRSGPQTAPLLSPLFKKQKKEVIEPYLGIEP
jgi:predicted MPP superfamily phosphohydrolase